MKKGVPLPQGVDLTRRQKVLRTVQWIGGAAALGMVWLAVRNYFGKAEESLEEEWLQSEGLKEETDLIASLLADPVRLREMSEADLRFAVGALPQVFDFLNSYRTNGAPQDLEKILVDYKAAQWAQKNNCGVESASDRSSLPIRLAGAKKKLDALNPKQLGSPLLNEQWAAVKRDLGFVEFAVSAKNCWMPEQMVDKLEQSIETLADAVQNIGSSIHPVGYLRSLLEAEKNGIDDGLFQHILGDYWGGGTGLEGYNALDMLQYVFKVVNQQIEALEKNPLCSDEDRSDLCQWISGEKDLGVYRKMQREISDAIALTKLYRTGAKELQKGLQSRLAGEEKSFFFMGGWTDEHGGHTLAYEIARQENGRFTFRVFNRGAGIEFHAGEIGKDKASSHPFLAFTDIDAEELTNYVFLKTLTELNAPAADNKYWKAGDVYQTLLPLLKGKKRTAKEGSLEAMELLKVGHCSYLSLTGLLRRQMGSAYGFFHLGLQLKTLSDYFEQIKGDLPNDFFRRGLLKKGLKQLAHNVEGALEKNGLTAAESSLVKGRLQEISEAIEAAEGASQKPTPFAAGVYSVQPIEGKLSRVYTHHFDIIGRYTLHYELDGLSFQANPKTFLQDCIAWRGRFQRDSGFGHYGVVKQAIKDWVRKIPISWIEHPEIFLKGLTPKEAESLLVEIAEIAKDFGFSQLKLVLSDSSRAEYLEPADVFAMMKLLTLGSAIGQTSGIAGGNLQGLYQWEMNLLLENSSGQFLLFDPELEAEIGTLRDYWNRIDPPEARAKREYLSFFGLEANPMNAADGYQTITDQEESRNPNFKWPDVEWAKNYLQLPEIKEKIAEEYPDLLLENPTFQAMAALIHFIEPIERHKGTSIDENKKSIFASDPSKRFFLPPAFYALRDLSHVLDFMQRPTSSWMESASHPASREKGMFFRADFQYNPLISSNEWVRSPETYAISFKRDSSQGRINYQKTYKGSFEGSGPADVNYFLESGQDALGRYRNVFGRPRWIFPAGARGQSLERLRVGPHLREYFPYKQFSETMNREEIDELLSLSSVKELQVVETLGFFKKRLFLFEKKEAQSLFLALMAEPPLLIEQLKRGGEPFARQLAAFVQEGAALFEKINPSVSAFMLDVNRYLSAASRQVFPSLQAGFLDGRAILRKRALDESLDLQARSAAWLDLTAELDPRTLDVQGAIDLVSAMAFSELHPLEKDHPHYSLSEITARIGQLSRFQKPLRKLLDSPEMDLILNSVFQLIYPGEGPRKWKAAPLYPEYTTIDRKFAIIASTGRIYQQDKIEIPIPKRLKGAAALKNFLDEKILTVRQLYDNHFEWTLPDGTGVRATEERDKWFVQREIEPGVWAEKKSPPLNFPVPPGLLIGGDLWAETEGSAQRFWISGPNGKLLTRVQISPSGSGALLIERLDSLNPYDLLEARLPPESSVFRTIDEAGFVVYWLDRGEVAEVEAPRLDLKFTVKNKRIELPELPGFFVAEREIRPFGSNAVPSFTFQNEQGKQKLCFVNPFYQKHTTFRAPKKNLFVFDLEGSDLRPKTSEDRLFLALLQLQAGDYEAALRSLKKYESQLLRLTEQERKLLELIVNSGDGKESDKSPSGIAIRLRAASLLLRDQLDFNGKAPLISKDPMDDLLFHYAQFLDQTPPPLRLGLKDEEWLLRNWQKNEKTLLLNRFNTLKGRWLFLTLEHTPEQSLKVDWKPVDSFFAYSYGATFYQFAGNQHNSENHSLLRREGLARSFKYFYFLARKGPDLNSYREWVEDLLGEKPDSDLGIEDLGALIDRSLLIIARSQTHAHERAAAVMLRAVFQNPRAAESDDLKISQLKNSASDLPQAYSLMDLAAKQLQEMKSLDLLETQAEKTAENIFPSLEKTADPAVCSVKSTVAFNNGEENPLSGLLELIRWERPQAPGKEKIFEKTLADPILQGEFSKLSEQLSAFTPEPIVRVRLKSLEALKEKKTELVGGSTLLKQELIRREGQILRIANKEPAEEKDKLLQELRKIGGFQHPLTLQDVFLLLLQANPSRVKEKIPALSCEESEQLLDLTKEYLTLATRQQKESRILAQIEVVETLIAKGALAQETELALEELERIASAKRAYWVDEHPEFLVFEHAMDLLLRDSQLESLRKMTSGTALEAIMGSGKTKVLLILMALAQANGKDLSMLVIPEDLLPDVAEIVKERLGASFSRSVELLHFDRNQSLDPNALERILDRMHTAIKERKVVLTSSSSLQSLILRFIECVQEDKTIEVFTFKKILSLLRASGSLRLDEMDFLLDVLKAQHFTQGLPEKVSEDLLDAATHVYRLLITSPALKEIVKWNFLPGSGRGSIPLTNESYKTLAPVLVDELLTPSDSLDREMNDFLRKMTLEQKELLKDYFQQKPNKQAGLFVHAVVSQRIKSILAVWKEEVSRLLLMTGKKQLGEHYGADPKGSVLAIPYQNSNNPMKGSQHGTDLEITNYALQMYLGQDLPMQTIRDEIEVLKTEMISEIKGNDRLTFEETKAYQKFLQLNGGRSDLTLFSIPLKDLEQIWKRVNRQAELKVGLIRRHLLPKIETYAKQLHTNAHIFETIFSNSAGFSGTLWNAQSFPRSYQNVVKSDTEARTLSLLWDAQCPISIVQPEKDLQKQVERLYQTHRGSFADLGAIFRGVDSEKVAAAIIALPIWKDSRIKGIAFYNEEKQKMVLLRATKKIVPFDQSGLNKNEIIAYWEQKYTTGSDIPLGADMRAVVTISQHTTMRDLLQAVWRLREIHRGQRVEFTLLQEDAAIMAETLKNAGMPMETPGAPTLAELFRFVKYNEAMRQGDDNLRALQFKLQNVLIQPLWEQILDPSPTGAEEELKEAVDELFVKAKPKNAYDVYGAVQETTPVEKAIEDMVKKLKGSTALKLLPLSQQQEILALWNLIIAKELPYLPLQTARTARYETQVEVQTQAKVNVNTEVKVDVEIEEKTVQDVQFDPSIPKRPVFLWKEQGLFKRGYFASTAAPQSPTPSHFPDGALALPDYESFRQVPHPKDYLDVNGEDVLARKGIRPLSPFGRFSDPALKRSWNAIENQKSQISLVIRDRASKKIEVLVLSQWDALMFQRLLEKDRLSPQQGEREVDLALHHLELGIIQQGSAPIDPVLLQESKEFARLKTQMRFFNGQTNYDKADIPILKEWIGKAGANNLKKIFVTEILKDKPASAGRYPDSTLETLL